jgi:hypothetical protein
MGRAIFGLVMGLLVTIALFGAFAVPMFMR